MEALLERGHDVENWNDDRLDELSRRVDAGFEEMRKGFARVDARLDKLFFAVITVGGGFAATTIASLLGILLI